MQKTIDGQTGAVAGAGKNPAAPHSFMRVVLLGVLIECALNVGCGADRETPDSYQPSPAIPRDEIARATYRGIQAFIEPVTGLPHDRRSIALLDVMPQFAHVRSIPSCAVGAGARLDADLCEGNECHHAGRYGLRFDYEMPRSSWGSYSIDAGSFDVSRAAFLEMWVKGASGGERFEIVLWSDCQGPFPGRPSDAVISAGRMWERRRLALANYANHATLSSLCRLSFGFNDAIHGGGTVFVDDVAFVDDHGRRVPLSPDETTSVSNIGLLMASVVGAVELGLQPYDEAVGMLRRTLTSLDHLQKRHGFPQTHNHIVSLRPSSSDTCYAAVDLGNLAISLLLVRNRMPELNDRVSALLAEMDWSWLFDSSVGLLYGCRYPDERASDWHYDWLLADSRLAYFIGIGTERLPAASWTKLDQSRESQRCAAQWNLRPAWQGGGLFMAFMPRIFLDEKQSELEIAAQNLLHDQICHQGVIGAPAWGWSATVLPPTGDAYCGYGCNQDNVVAPYACLLAADAITAEALERNLGALEQLGARPLARDGDESFDYGFMASVNWRTGETAPVQLLIDQSMAFLGLVNAGTNRRLPQILCNDAIVKRAITLIDDYNAACRSQS